MATGIGALVLAIVSLQQAFTRSEEGQNKFAKLMGIIGAVTGQFLDAIAGLGEKIITVFTSPKKAIIDFSNLIKENVVNRFEGLLELIPQLGKAIGLLFEGKFKEAGATAANAAGKVALGVDGIVDKTQNAINKTNKKNRILAEITELKNKLNKPKIIEQNIDRNKFGYPNGLMQKNNK